jgi:hypothetical protein
MFGAGAHAREKLAARKAGFRVGLFCISSQGLTAECGEIAEI